MGSAEAQERFREDSGQGNGHCRLGIPSFSNGSAVHWGLPPGHEGDEMLVLTRISSLCGPAAFPFSCVAPQFTEAFHRASHGVEPSITQPKGLNLWWVRKDNSHLPHLICNLSCSCPPLLYPPPGRILSLVPYSHSPRRILKPVGMSRGQEVKCPHFIHTNPLTHCAGS